MLSLLLVNPLLIETACAQGRSPVPSNKVHGRADAAYFVINSVFRYEADVNLWFDFGQYKDFVFFFNGGLLVYAEDNSDKTFQPRRLRGTLEPGTYLRKNRNTYYFYIKHQSFHDIDTFDNLDEAYEIYTLAYKYSGNPTFFVSAGKFLNTDDVDYDWEFVGWFEYPNLFHKSHNPVYFSGSVRRVEETGDLSDRNGFTDFTSELGVETAPGLRYYTGYRVIHDVNRFDGATDHEWAVGIKYLW